MIPKVAHCSGCSPELLAQLREGHKFPEGKTIDSSLAPKGDAIFRPMKDSRPEAEMEDLLELIAGGVLVAAEGEVQLVPYWWKWTGRDRPSQCRLLIDLEAKESKTLGWSDAFYHNLILYNFVAQVDLTHAYYQFALHPSCKLAISTPWGVFKFARLPQGTEAGRDLICRVLDDLVGDSIPFTNNCDDIQVWGMTAQECQANLDAMVKLLSDNGLVVNSKKIVAPVDLLAGDVKLHSESATGRSKERYKAMVSAAKSLVNFRSQSGEDLDEHTIKDVVGFKRRRIVLSAAPPELATFVDEDNYQPKRQRRTISS